MTRKEQHLKEQSQALEATVREHLNLIEASDHPDALVMTIISYPDENEGNDCVGRALVSGGSAHSFVNTISDIIKNLQEQQDSDELAVMLLAAVIDGICCSYHFHEKIMKAYTLLEELGEDEEPNEESRNHAEGILKKLFPRKH